MFRVKASAPTGAGPGPAWKAEALAAVGEAGVEGRAAVGRRPVGAMNEERPVEPAAQRAQMLAKRGKPRGVVLAVLLGARNHVAQAGFRIEKFGAPGIGEGFLDRIGDLNEVGACARAKDRAQCLVDLFDRVEEIAKQNDVGEALLARVSGGPGLRGALGMSAANPLGGVSRKDRVACAEEADALAGDGEQFG